jgi:hypothetical protein
VLIFYNYFVHETYINGYDLQSVLYKVLVDLMMCDYFILRTVTGLTRNFNLIRADEYCGNMVAKSVHAKSRQCAKPVDQATLTINGKIL